VCASNSAHPGLLQGSKITQPWTAQVITAETSCSSARFSSRLRVSSPVFTTFEHWSQLEGVRLVAQPGCQIEATGEYNSLSPGTAQLTTAKVVCVNASSNTRAVEYIRMAHTFELESTKLSLCFFVFYLDRTICKMSRHVQFHRVCATHLAYPEYTPLLD